MNKKVISLVLSIAMIVSCFACMAGLGVYAVDNAGLGSFLAKSPVKTVSTTAEEKAAGSGEAYPTFDGTSADTIKATYPYWHCACGNVWAGVSHNDDATAPDTDLHYLWGEGNCKNDGTDGCDGTLIKWEPLTSVGSGDVLKNGGNFFVTKRLGCAMTTMTANATLNIDLNGFELYKTSSRFFSFNSINGVRLTVSDTKGNGKMTAQKAGNQGGVFWINGNNDTVIIYGGTIKCTKATYGGVACIGSGTTAKPTSKFVTFDGVTLTAVGSHSTEGSLANGNGGVITSIGGTVKLYGTTVNSADITENAGATGTCYGGGIAATKAANVTIEDCTIVGGKATRGGAMYFEGTDASNRTMITLKNTTVSNGVSNEMGGNIYIAAQAQISLQGSTITGGNAATAGGNVYQTGSGAKIEQPAGADASIISNGTAGTTGGNLQAQGGTFTLRNITFSNGTAGTRGGNIWANSGLTLTACTVTGGTAAEGVGNGQSIYQNSNVLSIYQTTSVDGELYIANNNATARTHVISGTPTLSNLVLGAPHAATTNTFFNNTLNLNGLAAGAAITLTVDADEDFLSFAGQDFGSYEEAITRNIATNVTDERAECITVTNEGYVFVNDDGTGHLAVYVPTHTHKVAANSTSAAAKNQGQDEVTYTAVTTEAELAAAIAGVEAGTPLNIYLDANIELTDETIATNGASGIAYGLRIPVAGAVVNICLNGHTLSAYDGGEDAATNASSIFQFGAGAANNYSQLHICDCAEGAAKGGLVGTRTVDSSSAVQYAGIGYVGNQGRAYLYDTKVTGCASRNAGIIREATGFFQAYDTEFTNPAGANPAFQGTGANSAFLFYGCTINSVDATAVTMTTAVTSAGRATTLENCTVTCGAADAPALYIPGLLTLNGTSITAAGNAVELYRENSSSPVATITGGSIASTGGNALIIPATATANVTGGTTITSAMTEGSTTATVMVQGTLNMTGGSISNTGTKYAIYLNNVYSGATLNNVTLTTAGHRIGTVGTSGTAAPTLTLNNCTASTTATPSEGGLFYNYANININGGTYTGANVTNNGGVVINKAVGTLNIYGDATINGGSCKNGGAIFNEGTVSIYGDAVVNGGNVSAKAGSIYNAATATLNIYGNATVSGGSAAANDGGNIYTTFSGEDHSVLNIYGNAVVTGGTALRGGNIFNYGGTVTVSESAIIKDGAAVSDDNGSGNGNGGNFYQTGSGATITVSDSAQVKDGTASFSGGNISNNGALTITDATVTGGEAGSSGGNIFGASSSVITLTDATVTGGTAGKYGGNIRANAGTLTIEGSTITGGTSTDPMKIGEDVLMNKGTLTIDADSTIGDLATVYPFVDYTIAEGATITNHEFPTYNGSKSELILVADNTESAFNNWYLLTRGQTKDDGQKFIRFFALVDGEIENYKVAGFTVNYQGENVDLATHDVYNTNYVAGAELPIADYSLESDYYFRNEMTIDDSMIEAGATFTVTAYLEDNEGHVITGPTATVDLSKITFYKATANEG